MRINGLNRADLKDYADGDVALAALEGLHAATGATVREGEA